MASSRPSAFSFTQSGPYRLYSTAELLKMPPPTWLIDGVLPKGELSIMFAPPESYKSFVALDIALSVATGVDWQGRKIAEPGFVIYIAAEGTSGLGKRVQAWLQAHDVSADRADIAWLTESFAVTADSDALLALLERIESEVQRIPVLIVIDTLARCFDGEENETGDMSRFVSGCDVLRHKFQCGVLVIHHTRMDGQRERGNTALRAGARMMMALDRDDTQLLLRCDKMNDTEHYEDILLDFEKLVIGEDEQGREITSGVLVASKREAAKSREDAQMLASLSMHPDVTYEEWKQYSGLSPVAFARAFHRVKAQIVKDESTKPPKWRRIQ